MVEEIKKEGKKYNICEECGFAYMDKETAQKCEDWCNKHHSCNLEITKSAVQI
ncbi:MAG: hypothetical protein IH842_00660 [Thaumarchaeota archaeon]|nr:hypothetical protein [Nitrososphaerota archaeon]